MDVEPLMAERALDVAQRRDLRLVSQVGTALGAGVSDRYRGGNVLSRSPFRVASHVLAMIHQLSPDEGTQESGSPHHDEDQSDERSEDPKDQWWGSEVIERSQPQVTEQGNADPGEGEAKSSEHQT